MTIIWDWNGTLVADVPHVVKMNNLVLEQFGYRHTSEEEYRARFRHPVHEYYYDLGVTEEDFPKIARVWNKAYVDGFDCVPLASGVAEAVKRFQEAGHKQVIISASQVDQLRAQVAHFPEFDGVFDEVLGLSNQLAVSKVHLAVDYLARTGEKAEDCVFIGDTTHDAETAKAIGCRCFLIEGGHQERKVLDTAENATVLGSLKEAVELATKKGLGPMALPGSRPRRPWWGTGQRPCSGPAGPKKRAPFENPTDSRNSSRSRKEADVISGLRIAATGRTPQSPKGDSSPTKGSLWRNGLIRLRSAFSKPRESTFLDAGKVKGLVAWLFCSGDAVQGQVTNGRPYGMPFCWKAALCSVRAMMARTTAPNRDVSLHANVA